MVLPIHITRCIVIMGIAVLTILFPQSFTRSLSLSPPPYRKISTSTRSMHQFSLRTFLLYSNQPNSDHYGEKIAPSHEFHDEDSYLPIMHRRKRNRHENEWNLSERDRQKLKAMSSFDGDDEWDEYANINFDNFSDHLDEGSVAAGASEMNAAPVNRTQIAKNRRNMTAISPQDETLAALTEIDGEMIQSRTKRSQFFGNDPSSASSRSSLPQDDVNTKTDHGQPTNQLSQDQASSILNNVTPPQHLKVDSTPVASQQTGDEMSVSEFRRKYKTKSHDTSVATASAPNELNTFAGSTKIPRTRITNEQIEEIKSSISIVDAIESYNLRDFTRTNTHSAKACCPFHDDNNPSMSIDDNRGLYKCFACGAGGDLFNFIREFDALRGSKEKMGFMTAVQYAVQEFGGEQLAQLGDLATQGRDWGNGMSDEAKSKVIERERRKDR